MEDQGGNNIFDYAIVGAGAAGLQLALMMMEDDFFCNKNILLVDRDLKESNDRTWCFWEKGAGRYDHILHNSWEQAAFYSNSLEKEFTLDPYRYKMLRGLDFYSNAKATLSKFPNICWVTDEIQSIEGEEPVRLIGENKRYRTKVLFDSRIEPGFKESGEDFNTLLQHFLGWEVSFDKEIFDPETFVMMDFRHQWKDTTSFMYILPFSPNRALLEYTLFSADLLRTKDYELMIQNYISTYLPEAGSYTIHEKEQGIIPMTDYPFDQQVAENHLRIGTAGGWVKGSSGYSFRNASKNSEQIIQNLKTGEPLSSGLVKKRFKFYDSLFLEVLDKHNDRGGELFSQMYGGNTPEKILKFLDEETSLREEFFILNSFSKKPFIQAVLNRMLG